MTSSTHQAFKILYIVFIAVPFLAGLDKFFDLLVYWPIYLSPLVKQMVNPDIFMRIVGVIEMAAGITVALRPRYGSIIVALWLVGIVINLLSFPGYYDIAVRDLSLAAGALALWFLAKTHTFR